MFKVILVGIGETVVQLLQFHIYLGSFLNNLFREDLMVVAHGSRKTIKLIYGMEGENVVANGRLPSPAPLNLGINNSIQIHLLCMRYSLNNVVTMK